MELRTPNPPRTLRLSLVLCVALAACGAHPPLDPSRTSGTAGDANGGATGFGGATSEPATAGTTGTAGSPATAGTTGLAGTTGVAGATGLAGTSGVAGATGLAGTPGTAGSPGPQIVFAPGSTTFSPREIRLQRPGYTCGPVQPLGGGYDPLSVTLLGFALSGDPECNLFITLNPGVPLNTDLVLQAGEPIMVTFMNGPNGEIVDPSFDQGAASPDLAQASVNFDLALGLRSKPILFGQVTLDVLALPRQYGDSFRVRVRASLIEGGFLDFTVSGILNQPTPVACPACQPGAFCPG